MKFLVQNYFRYSDWPWVGFYIHVHCIIKMINANLLANPLIHCFSFTIHFEKLVLIAFFGALYIHKLFCDCHKRKYLTVKTTSLIVDQIFAELPCLGPLQQESYLFSKYPILLERNKNYFVAYKKKFIGKIN